jgi:hypothetical protein
MEQRHRLDRRRQTPPPNLRPASSLARPLAVVSLVAVFVALVLIAGGLDLSALVKLAIGVLAFATVVVGLFGNVVLLKANQIAYEKEWLSYQRELLKQSLEAPSSNGEQREAD